MKVESKESFGTVNLLYTLLVMREILGYVETSDQFEVSSTENVVTRCSLSFLSSRERESVGQGREFRHTSDLFFHALSLRVSVASASRLNRQVTLFLPCF